ncbi:MAG: hypothetical protein AVDCRST_MAG77-3066, partial [uncultured Chloroflexi bacterium]
AEAVGGGWRSSARGAAGAALRAVRVVAARQEHPGDTSWRGLLGAGGDRLV